MTVSSEGFDAIAFRNCLGAFATGVTIVTTTVDGEVHGMTANAFMSVSLDPPLVLVSVAEKARMASLLPQSGHYCVSILGKEHEAVAMHFAGRPSLEADEIFDVSNELPLISGAVAHLSCRITAVHPAGDHTLFIGQVENLWYPGGEPLLFHSGKFCSVGRGD